MMCIPCYLVRENFMANPKSCVVVGYELFESRGVFVCLSRKKLMVRSLDIV